MMKNQTINPDCWNVLIVDDKIDLHTITINVFFEEKIDNRAINFLSAINKREAIDILDNYHNDITVILLDMVMSDYGNEGISVLKYLKQYLKNQKTQVILRTGYSGKSEVRNINKKFPDVIILQKGDTDDETLIQLVTKAIVKFKKKSN